MNDEIERVVEEDSFRCGFASIIGRPNVGKSTLLNRLIGQKISITSRKPQTTQRRLSGISTDAQSQVIYIDTPGLQNRHQDALNQYMKKEISTALAGVDVIIFVIEALKWGSADDEILKLIRSNAAPVLLVINKVDKIRDKQLLLPFLNEISGKENFANIIPVSARKGSQVRELENKIRSMLPRTEAQYPEEQISDRSARYMLAEFIREKLINMLGMEVPYKLTVSIEKFSETADRVEVDAIIWVESKSQKSIVIGKEGKVLKAAGERARKDMEILLGQKVYLRSWVKIRKNWTNDEELMRGLGFGEQA